MSNPSDANNPGEMSDASGINGEVLRLDGNAAAGMLSELFTHDMTSAQSTCAQCGHTAPLGGLMLYGGQVGMVLRCPTCDAVEMRLVYVAERGGEYWLDLRGMSTLRITPTTVA